MFCFMEYSQIYVEDFCLLDNLILSILQIEYICIPMGLFDKVDSLLHSPLSQWFFLMSEIRDKV